MTTSKISPKGRIELMEIKKLRQEIRGMISGRCNVTEIEVKIEHINQILNELKEEKNKRLNHNRYVMKNLEL